MMMTIERMVEILRDNGMMTDSDARNAAREIINASVADARSRADRDVLLCGHGFYVVRHEAIAQHIPAEAVAGNPDLAEVVCTALRRAWSLGQTYWSQADSESTSQWKKADGTQAAFNQLVSETRTAVLASGGAL